MAELADAYGSGPYDFIVRVRVPFSALIKELLFRLSLIRYSEKFGVPKAAIKYQVKRQYIYRWKKRFDGSLDSLSYRSKKPHSHPKQHTSEGT